MPALSSTKALRSQTLPIRKDKSGSRRSSLHSSMFDAHSTDPLPSSRRRVSGRATKDMRSSSLPQPSSHFAAMGANLMANGTSPALQSSTSSQSPDNLEDAPRTKTGRISTAKKGKPVHKCDICGKIYTRNEHLKRHQLNHSTKSISCDVPRCRKKFQRIDLLQRHKEQEHDMDSTDPVSERLTHNGDTASDIERRQSAMTYPPPTRLNSVWDSSSVQSSPGMSGSGLTGSYPPDLAQIDPLYPTWDGYGNNLFAPPMTSNAEHFNQSTFDATGSRSPASATSAHPLWAQPYDHQNRQRHTFSPTSTDASTPSIPTPFAGVQPAEFDNAPNYYEAQDNREDTIIATELGTILTSQDTFGFQPHLASLDRRYLDAYWAFFDPLFSVINRFTFEASDASPLVKALMIAIGAYHLGDQAAQTLSRTLRETCSKLLQERMMMDYSHSRLWDLQAIFLFEAFSVYCSRRPHGRFSQRFEELLVGLISDRDNAYYTSPLSVIDMTTANMFGVAESSQRIPWVHLESKRRLLLACYTLEVQQNLFFGSHRPVSDKNLPIPCSKPLWEAKNLEEWQYLAQQESSGSRSLADVLTASYAGESTIADSFLLNVAIAHSSHSAMMDTASSAPLAPQTQNQTPASLFAADAAFLAIHSPVLELLAVSGETFVLGQKLATQDQYHEAFEKLKSWATSGSSLPALQSASRLFNMALQQERIGLVYEDWALMLAALVFWACLMWPQQEKIQGSISPLPPHGITELARRAVNMAVGRPETAWQEGKAMNWGGARACLAYVRQRIDGRIGWLVQDACGVLGKLIDGRMIDDVHSDEDTA